MIWTKDLIPRDDLKVSHEISAILNEINFILYHVKTSENFMSTDFRVSKRIYLSKCIVV